MTVARSFTELSNKFAGTAPLLPVAAGIVIGIVLDRATSPPLWMLWTVLASGTLILILPVARLLFGPMLLLLVAASAGGLLHAQRTRQTDPTSVERIATPTGALVRLRGVIASPPRVIPKPPNPFSRWTYGDDRTAFVLQAKEIESANGWENVSGRVRTTFNEVLVDVAEGDFVEVFGRVSSLTPPSNPGSFDWAAFNRSQGIVARLNCGHRESLIKLTAANPGLDLKLRLWLKNKLRGWLMSDLSTSVEDEGGLLEAMILGQQSHVDRKLNEVFIQSGCIHFLAASGTNVVIVFFLAQLPLRLLGVSQRKRAYVMVAVAIAYALITDARPPILRATIIGLVYCVSILANRTRSHLNWICLTVIILAIIDPAMVFDVGYQLSTAAVLGVSFLAPALISLCRSIYANLKARLVRSKESPLEDLLKSVAANPEGTISLSYRFKLVAKKFARWVGIALAVAVSAWLMALPITTTTFHQLQPWGAINSVIIFPLMSLVMGLGFAKLVLTPISPTLSGILGMGLSLLDRIIVTIVQWMSQFPGANASTPQPTWWLIATYYAFLLAIILRFDPRRNSAPLQEIENQSEESVNNFDQTKPVPYLRFFNSLFAASSIALVVSIVVWCIPPTPSGILRITALSVGRGSTTVIELPDGKAVLCDVGSSATNDVGENVVLPFLRYRNIDRIERTYISHPNMDHFSGLPSVLRGINCGPVLVNEYFAPMSEPSSPSKHLLKLMEQSGHTPTTIESSDRTWSVGDVTFDILWPPPGQRFTKDNDTSTVIRIAYAGRSVLLTGDIEEAAQERLIALGGLSADVLFLPHHGSVRPNTRRFIQAVAPSIAIRSAIERMDENTTGLAETVDDLPLLNTADVGAIEITISPTELTVGPASLPHKKRYKVVR